MARPDSRPLLPGIEIPTLVLVGDGDAITPPDIAREMAEMIEWASLVVIPGAGHLSAMEKPDLVTHAMRLWLDRLTSKWIAACGRMFLWSINRYQSAT